MKMIRPGKMISMVLGSLFKKPLTTKYPYVKSKPIEGSRGKIEFYPEKCIGCKLCMKDCPTKAITIRDTGDKKFEAEFDLGKCIYCGQCVDSCLKKALAITDEFELAELDPKKLRIIFHAKPKEDTKEQT
jgi:formate hydrogenlyase subunit 6/NADH:ubiquinone oxidoreductase subunit I